MAWRKETWSKSWLPFLSKPRLIAQASRQSPIHASISLPGLPRRGVAQIRQGDGWENQEKPMDKTLQQVALAPAALVAFSALQTNSARQLRP